MFAQEQAGSQLQSRSLPAERIVGILRENPTLLSQVKKVAIEALQERGQNIFESELTDAVLFSRIRSDAQLRDMLSEELVKRGYADEPPRSSDDQQRSSDDQRSGLREPASPQLRRRSSADQKTDTGVQSPALQSQQEPNQPDVARRPTPYADLPSLYDLYAQIPSGQTPLRRFGEDIFRAGATPLQDLPIDLPVGPDYVLGPGDSINVDLWGSISQQLRRVIDPQGQIALPESGTVMLAGRTLADASKLIQSTLRRQFKDVKVDVSLGRLRTVRIYVVGDIQTPGAYDISSLSTPLNALIAAGGPTTRGSLRAIRHYRGERLISEVDLYDLLLRGVRSGIERLEPGDSILVPPVGPEVTVQGMVRRPAIYELKNEQNLADVLELAGGVLVSGNMHQIKVQRIEANERRVTLSFDLPDTRDKEALKKALAGFHVQDGDRTIVSPILPYSEKTVYLEGHVFRPGKYPYTKGTKVRDLIRSYKDLLPEPAERAEIVRLQAPDFRPTVIDFNVGDVLTGDDPIELQPFDTVRIFGRYEFDAPKVSIYGEVLRPAEYPLAEGMSASALVRLAGGFKRSAFADTADLASYVVQNGTKVLTEHRTVEIGAALSGDAKADVFLKPGDVLTVRQLTGWNDIGASVTLNGEVAHPGTYGISEGEKLSLLIQRAGGFRESAYPNGASLERQQVRDLDQKSRLALIRRIEFAAPPAALASAQEETVNAAAFAQQQQQIVSQLKNELPVGRLVIKISKDITRWENTPADIELRSGDVLLIPKKPSFVLVNGQANNPAAITFAPGKNAGWYLARAGGATDSGNKKEIFVIRADGSVVGRSGMSEWWTGNVLSTVLQPGDTVVVPEKIQSSSTFWRNLLNTAQITSSLAIAARVATSF